MGKGMKVSVLFLAFAVVLAFSTGAMAEDVLKVKGTVSKIDTAAKSITITPKTGDQVTVIMEDADQLDRVKEGEKGEVRYSVKDGVNTGVKVRKITGGCE